MPFNIEQWLEENEPLYPTAYSPSHLRPQAQRRELRVSLDQKMAWARNYVNAIERSIEGEHGSDQALYCACCLINGFDLELSEARAIFDWWNQDCVPPWKPSEIDHKFTDAQNRDQEKPRGYLIQRFVDRRREGQRERQIVDQALRQDGQATQPAEARPPTAVMENETAQEEGVGGNDGQPPADVPDDPPDEGIHWGVPQEVTVTSEEHIVNSEVYLILRDDPQVYQRGGLLVEEIRAQDHDQRIRNNKGHFELSPISPAKLRHIISRNVNFIRMTPIRNDDDDPDAEPEFRRSRIHVPDWCVKSIYGWGAYPGYKRLDGITQTPIIHEDGSVFSTPGYDPVSYLIYEPSGQFPDIPNTVTHQDAKDAAQRILEIVCDFPWEEIGDDGGGVHKSVWLASLLTVLFRNLVDDCCPAFLFTANVAGSGKSMLTDIISIISSGNRMPRSSYSEREEEFEKVIVSILIKSKPYVLIDNIKNGGDLGGSVFDSLLTSKIYSGRLLKTNKTPDFDVRTIFFATGNQISLKGDTHRRVMIGKLKSQMESPELRSEDSFKIKNLLKHVEANRISLITDCLTIMKAYILAGRPKGNLTSIGSYIEWSKHIRESVNWATGHDPVKSQYHARKEDRHSLQKISILNGWAELPGSEQGLTIDEALKYLDADISKLEFQILRGFLSDINRSERNEYPPKQVIGKFLGMAKDIVIGGRYLKQITGKYNGTNWAVVPVESEVTPDDPDMMDEDEDEGNGNFATSHDVPF